MDYKLKKALLEHAERVIPPLEWGMDVRLTLDEDRLSTLSEAISQNGTKWEKLQANRSALKLIPDRPGLYMFVWRLQVSLHTASEGTYQFRKVLYVGKAGPGGASTIRKRFSAEYLRHIEGDPSALWTTKFQTRHDRLSKLLLLQGLELWHCCSRGDEAHLQNWENDLIKVFSPPGNIINRSPRAKLGKARTAF